MPSACRVRTGAAKELSNDDRQRLIYTKDMLLAPLLPGMEAPPHPMRLGTAEDYYARGPELLAEAGTAEPGSQGSDEEVEAAVDTSVGDPDRAETRS